MPCSLGLLPLINYLGYIDPSAASGIIAMLIGLVAGVGMTLKLYWYKIKQRISGNSSKS